MTLQFNVYLKQLPTVRTVIWSSVAVYKTFMCLQVAGMVETFVTVNICTVCLLCGLSCECLDVQTH